ncbi:MAG: MarR family transcriptional regulator [Candidatus Goldbacteria bacterium]|nr:MarR family transcriptional regulator [Candidatus Goldiibacteriota bacterium]
MNKDAQKAFDMLVDISDRIRKSRKISIFKGEIKQLNLGQTFTLQLLFDSGRKTMGELAKAAGIKMPSMTESIARLEKLGYVEKKRDKKDKRKVFVELSERGKKIMKKTRDINLGYLGMFFSMISGRERQNAMELLKKIQGLLKKL